MQMTPAESRRHFSRQAELDASTTRSYGAASIFRFAHHTRGIDTFPLGRFVHAGAGTYATRAKRAQRKGPRRAARKESAFQRH